MEKNTKKISKEEQIIKSLSDRIVEAQHPIRILDAIKWDDSVKQDFFKNKFKKLPPIDATYYEKHPLSFNPNEKIEEFHEIIRDAQQKLGKYHALGTMMIDMSEEYIKACLMLKARGTEEFSNFATELYGSPEDVFYPAGPKLKVLASLLGDVLSELKEEVATEADVKRYTAQEAVEILQERLNNYFHRKDQVNVIVDDNIVADAAAGSDKIKLNQDALFSDRDINYLEVHEGWVHVGTTLNGLTQPICTFLSKGSPSSAVTQEGLAVATEIFTFSSSPQRILKIVNRLKALDMANQGANFIEVFNFFLEHNINEDLSYNYAMRIFRGSAPDGKPFTKDLAYTKGFLLIYNYIRLSIKQGSLNHIPAMFVGKVLLKNIPVIHQYMEEGMITPPTYIPQQFDDPSALASWIVFSLYLNKLDLDKVAESLQF